MNDLTLSDSWLPVFKLAQRNAAALTRYAFSPEVLSQVAANASGVLRRGQDAVAESASPSALSELVQGLCSNYFQFFADVARHSTGLLLQGQSALFGQARRAVEATTIEAAAS